jgi:hypothetical protein
MANKWLVHIKKTMKSMKSKGTYKKGMGLKQVILAAKKTWHKGKMRGGKDGSDSDSDEEKPASGAEASDADAALATDGGRRKTRRRRTSRRR